MRRISACLFLGEEGESVFRIFTRFHWFFKIYWKRYLFAIIGLITASALGLIPPKIVGLAIDHIQFETLTSKILFTILGAYALVMVMHYIVGFLWDFTLFSGAARLEKMFRSKLMNQLLRMSPRFFAKFRTGDLMARATNDLQAISLTAGFGILTLVDSTTFTLMIIAMMGFTISWKLTLAALLPIPLMGLLMNKYGKIIHMRFTEAQAAFGELNNGVLESIRGVRVLRSFVQEKQDNARFQEMTENVYEKNVEVAKIDSLFEPTMNVLVGLSYTVGLGYGALLVFENQMTLGELVSFNVYLGMLIWPMFAFGELINVLQRGNASLDRVHHVLDYEPDIVDPKNPVHISDVHTIQFKDISFAYPSSTKNVLSHVNIHVNKGETIGIVGKTGGGKSTVCRLLLREYDDYEGLIEINNFPLEQISLQDIRTWIGYVPQKQFLFSTTIRENIKYGNQEATDEQIYEVLEKAHFLDDVKQLPEGLDTVVGESGVTLSGGQQQRVSLARAFIKQPEILILDDSLSAVDGKTESHIIDHLKRERAHKTTIIVAHRLSAVKHADHIIVLEQGKIVEEGTHEYLMSVGGWYKDQYKMQQIEEKEVDEK